MMDLNALNPMQRKAAETLEGPVLILAGAGSGKTRTLTYRIANLIDHGVKPWHILALTFTNKAAREMRERVEKQVGADAQEMWLGTFHSICVRILRRDIEKLGYQRSFTIYDDDDQLRVIKDGLKALNLDENRISPKEIRNKISDAKNKMLTPDEWFRDSARDYQCQQIHDVFSYYEERLRAANALDFDDLLLRTLQLFVDHPPVLDYYRSRFQYVHVDEYQDTNAAQYTFVRLLTQESRNLCVVGDDDQSIYGWRGADIRNILDFEQDFPDTQVIKLEQNYRSTSNILDAANQVIAHNFGRKEKALWTDAGEGEKIHLYSAGDEREEAAWICERVRRLRQMDVPYSQIAVLYRMHAQSRVIEEMFTRAGIPYKIFGGTRFYDRKEIRDALAYLRVIVNPADDVSLTRIINTPKRSIGDSTVAVLQEHARQEELPLYSVLNDPPESLSSRPRKCIADFALLLMKLTAMKDVLSLSELVETVLKDTGLRAQFEIEGSDEAKTRLENLDEFAGAAKEF
ncbi:MAG: UvrD-helicase domain-containing protein, partial [Clostridia bacterium]|nr:UvrD-helicase domain-containing protein [Clostridia bacterium]